MKCAVFYGKHDLRVEERPVPALGPKDVLVQVKACGVCGTCRDRLKAFRLNGAEDPIEYERFPEDI